MHFQLPDDLVALQGRIREFVRTELKPHDAAIEETGDVPEHAMAGLRRMGLFGTNTPKQFGGLGLSMLGSCISKPSMHGRSRSCSRSERTAPHDGRPCVSNGMLSLGE